MHFLSCPGLLAWQFEPITLACEDMATHFYIRTGCQLPHYMFVHCSMCPFLFLVSFALTWQLQHLLNCLMNCRFLMKPMCLVATFIVGQSQGVWVFIVTYCLEMLFCEQCRKFFVDEFQVMIVANEPQIEVVVFQSAVRRQT